MNDECSIIFIQRNTHTDDILSVAYGDPYFLATSSFDGEVSHTM